MSALQIVFAGMGLLFTGGIGAWFLIGKQRKKLTADTTATEVDTAVAVVGAQIAAGGAGDERLLKIIKTQTEDIVKPLQEEVDRLRGDVAGLRSEVATLSRLFRLALDWIRQVQVWKTWHKDLDPPLPALPPEIADEL